MNENYTKEVQFGIPVITVKEMSILEALHIADEATIEVEPDFNFSVSEIYESDISYSFRFYKDGTTVRFYQLLK